MRKDIDGKWLQKRQGHTNSIHLFQQSPELSHVQDHSLTGRSRMFPNAVANGNASLLISNVELTDEGEYTCLIVMDGAGYRDTSVLTVVASYEQPELQQVLEQEAVSLSCVSRKGFPAALVSWIDDRGGSYSQEAITELTLTPEGLYDAHSRLKRAFSSQRRVCCIITNSPLQERKRSCVQLGAEQQEDGRTRDIYTLMVSVMFVIVLLILLYCWYCRKRTPQKSPGPTEKNRKRISSFSQLVTVRMLSLRRQGLSSLLNSCLYIYEDKEPYQNVASSRAPAPLGTQALEIQLTESITLKKEQLFEIVEDKTFWSPKDSKEVYLSRWRDERSKDFINVYVHRGDMKLYDVLQKEIKQLFEDVKLLTESYPITVLTKKNRGVEKELKYFFLNLGCRHVVSVHNYTIDDHSRSSDRDNDILDFMNICLDEGLRSTCELDPSPSSSASSLIPLINTLLSRKKSFRMDP
ncbi:butyrophilin subfamily 1 member A1-like [Lepisosteus oculatus]|uniref:butyrophilin subfamily 1 member A1-like n=1 Tax=Lepisosteus oculatus TaxID=7918 RepID=UPI0035F52AC8